MSRIKETVEEWRARNRREAEERDRKYYKELEEKPTREAEDNEKRMASIVQCELTYMLINPGHKPSDNVIEWARKKVEERRRNGEWLTPNREISALSALME